MAIHDADKDNTDRGSPAVNGHDLSSRDRMAHGTNSVNYHTDASTSSGPSLLGGNAQLVASGVIAHTISDGAAGTIRLNTSTFAHGLGFAPLMIATLNDVTVNNVPTGFNIPLPMIVSASAGDAFGDNASIQVTTWLFYAADATNIYIISYGSANTVGALYRVTYYLYRQTGN